MKFLGVLGLILFVAFPAAAESLRIDFSGGLGDWEEKVFHGRTNYQLVEDAGHKVLQAESAGKASALIHWQDIDPSRFSTLRWRWKINRVLDKGQVGTKEGDDYPARIYIIFDSWLPNYARSINYIWASHAAQESFLASPYYGRSMMLAVESGTEKVGAWVLVERNILDDYQRVFGGKVPLIKAVAIMTDGDNTGETNLAWYDWIEFSSGGD